MSRRRFFVLDVPCPGSEIAGLMGRVVINKLDPLQKSAPFESTSSPHNPHHIIPDILPKPSISTKRKEILSVANSQGLGLAVGSLFGINFARSNEEKVQLESQVVKQYTLRNPDDIFDTLMENELYAADVQALLKGSGKRHGYLVTGFLTTTGTLWTRTGAQSRTEEVSVTVPVSQIAGAGFPLPGLTDPTIEPSHSSHVSQYRKMYVADEEVFAVSYSLVKVKYSFHKDASHFTRKTPTVGVPKRANIRHLALSDYSAGAAHTDFEDATVGDMFLAEIEDEEEEGNTFGEEHSLLL